MHPTPLADGGRQKVSNDFAGVTKFWHIKTDTTITTTLFMNGTSGQSWGYSVFRMYFTGHVTCFFSSSFICHYRSKWEDQEAEDYSVVRWPSRWTNTRMDQWLMDNIFDSIYLSFRIASFIFWKRYNVFLSHSLWKLVRYTMVYDRFPSFKFSITKNMASMFSLYVTRSSQYCIVSHLLNVWYLSNDKLLVDNL